MIGGLIATVGTFLASYSQSLTHILVSYGVISGLLTHCCYFYTCKF